MFLLMAACRSSSLILDKGITNSIAATGISIPCQPTSWGLGSGDAVPLRPNVLTIFVMYRAVLSIAAFESWTFAFLVELYVVMSVDTAAMAFDVSNESQSASYTFCLVFSNSDCSVLSVVGRA